MKTLFRKNLGAIGFCLIGQSAFSFTDAICKWLAQDYTVSEVICLTNIINLLISAIWIIGWHGGPRGLISSPHFKWHILRGICVSSTAFLVVHAFALLPLADFYGIVFLAPLVLSLLSYVILKERIGWHRMTAIIIGFGGVLILACPQFRTYNAGILFALASVFFISGNVLIIRKIRSETVMPLFAFYPALLNVIVNAALMLPDFKMPEIGHLPVFAIVSPLLMVGMMAGAAGFARASETAVIAPFHYVQMLWGVALGYLLFSDIPSASTMAGAGIIIASGLYMIWREHVLHKETMLPAEDLVG